MLQESTATTLRRLVVPVYLPMILGSIGPTMLIPVLPLYLDDAGLGIGAVSLVLAGVGIGGAAASLPVGGAMARYGERMTLVAALIAMTLSTAPVGLTDGVVVLLGLRFIVGAAQGAIRLTRQMFVTRRVVAGQRGRSLSLIGGAYRLSSLIGPLVGGLLADGIGYRWTFVVAAATAVVALIPAWLSDRDAMPLLPEVEASAASELGLFAGLRAHWRRVLVGGAVPLLVMAAREGRFIVLPLIAAGLDLSATQIGAIVAIGTGADLVLFPVAGWIMDRFGRLNAMVPAFTLVSIGLVWLGLTGSTLGVVGAGALMGIGNGLASGTMLTLGSDLAPVDAPGPFLAGMNLMQAGGRIVGSAIVGIVGDAAGLGAASVALAIALMMAVAWMLTMIGETSSTATRRLAILR